jgi:hypothetical protein
MPGSERNPSAARARGRCIKIAAGWRAFADRLFERTFDHHVLAILRTLAPAAKRPHGYSAQLVDPV